ncbi:MAG TPA: hypothetical protein VJH04_03230 [archaeon]|nr:hypothetical protein [archaeon]
MKILRSALLCASLALLTPSEISSQTSQNATLGIPLRYSEFRDDFDKFSIWQRGGNGGKAEPVYEGVGNSRALLIKADDGTDKTNEIYRLLNPVDKWQISFDAKDLTENREGAWGVGASEVLEKVTRNFKRAYFAGAGGYDGLAGVYSESDDGITPVMSDVKKGKNFHSYSIKCDGSRIYFDVDGHPQGSVKGAFKPGKIYAFLNNGGHIVIDNFEFKRQ